MAGWPTILIVCYYLNCITNPSVSGELSQSRVYFPNEYVFTSANNEEDAQRERNFSTYLTKLGSEEKSFADLDSMRARLMAEQHKHIPLAGLPSWNNDEADRNDIKWYDLNAESFDPDYEMKDIILLPDQEAGNNTAAENTTASATNAGAAAAAAAAAAAVASAAVVQRHKALGEELLDDAKSDPNEGKTDGVYDIMNLLNSSAESEGENILRKLNKDEKAFSVGNRVAIPVSNDEFGSARELEDPLPASQSNLDNADYGDAGDSGKSNIEPDEIFAERNAKKLVGYHSGSSKFHYNGGGSSAANSVIMGAMSTGSQYRLDPRLSDVIITSGRNNQALPIGQINPITRPIVRHHNDSFANIGGETLYSLDSPPEPKFDPDLGEMIASDKNGSQYKPIVTRPISRHRSKFVRPIAADKPSAREGVDPDRLLTPQSVPIHSIRPFHKSHFNGSKAWRPEVKSMHFASADRIPYASDPEGRPYSRNKAPNRPPFNHRNSGNRRFEGSRKPWLKHYAEFHKGRDRGEGVLLAHNNHMGKPLFYDRNKNLYVVDQDGNYFKVNRNMMTGQDHGRLGPLRLGDQELSPGPNSPSGRLHKSNEFAEGNVLLESGKSDLAHGHHLKASSGILEKDGLRGNDMILDDTNSSATISNIFIEKGGDPDLQEKKNIGEQRFPGDFLFIQNNRVNPRVTERRKNSSLTSSSDLGLFGTKTDDALERNYFRSHYRNNNGLIPKSYGGSGRKSGLMKNVDDSHNLNGDSYFLLNKNEVSQEGENEDGSPVMDKSLKLRDSSTKLHFDQEEKSHLLEESPDYLNVGLQNDAELVEDDSTDVADHFPNNLSAIVQENTVNNQDVDMKPMERIRRYPLENQVDDENEPDTDDLEEFRSGGLHRSKVKCNFRMEPSDHESDTETSGANESASSEIHEVRVPTASHGTFTHHEHGNPVAYQKYTSNSNFGKDRSPLETEMNNYGMKMGDHDNDMDMPNKEEVSRSRPGSSGGSETEQNRDDVDQENQQIQSHFKSSVEFPSSGQNRKTGTDEPIANDPTDTGGDEQAFENINGLLNKFYGKLQGKKLMGSDGNAIIDKTENSLFPTAMINTMHKALLPSIVPSIGLGPWKQHTIAVQHENPSVSRANYKKFPVSMSSDGEREVEDGIERQISGQTGKIQNSSGGNHHYKLNDEEIRQREESSDIETEPMHDKQLKASEVHHSQTNQMYPQTNKISESNLPGKEVDSDDIELDRDFEAKGNEGKINSKYRNEIKEHDTRVHSSKVSNGIPMNGRHNSLSKPYESSKNYDGGFWNGELGPIAGNCKNKSLVIALVNPLSITIGAELLVSTTENGFDSYITSDEPIFGVNEMPQKPYEVADNKMNPKNSMKGHGRMDNVKWFEPTSSRKGASSHQEGNQRIHQVIPSTKQTSGSEDEFGKSMQISENALKSKMSWKMGNVQPERTKWSEQVAEATQRGGIKRLMHESNLNMHATTVKKYKHTQASDAPLKISNMLSSMRESKFEDDANGGFDRIPAFLYNGKNATSSPFDNKETVFEKIRQGAIEGYAKMPGTDFYYKTRSSFFNDVPTEEYKSVNIADEPYSRASDGASHADIHTFEDSDMGEEESDQALVNRRKVEEDPEDEVQPSPEVGEDNENLQDDEVEATTP